ncbi:MAG: TetR/AcrR family transcriptional regulator [Clostridia bacterium]|nr:TetR/AcrR family transcriptional regulator [Clostridia bacterium]
MNTKNNQRSRDTIERIVRTTTAIMSEKKKPVNKITVNEVCQQAGINRSTFYAHFLDVYDVVEKVERTMAEQLTRSFLDKMEEGGGLDACYTEVFRFVREYQAFYRFYFSSFRRSEVIGVAWDLLKDRTEKLTFQDFGYQSQEEMIYHGEFFVFGLTAMLRHWVERECPESPEEMLNILKRQYTPPIHMFQWSEQQA